MSYIEPSYILPPDTSYNGFVYAFDGSGGFYVDQSFNPIVLAVPTVLNRYDVIDSIQMWFSARTLNTKLGIMKDASNINVVEALFDISSDTLINDKISISTCDYINGINTRSVISVGRLEFLYSDFEYTVKSYFGDPGAFASLFSNANTFDINNGIFDASAYIQVVNSSQFTMTGSFVSDLSGVITISDINRVLRNAVDGDVFKNRNPIPVGGALSINGNKPNYGMVDGFIAGDLIFIPEGFTITLTLDIQPETLPPTNNIGPRFLSDISNQINWTKNHVKRTTTYTTTKITQTTVIPILLSLVDDSLENYTLFGQSWTIASNIVYSGIVGVNAYKNWVAISISTTGKYQTAITDGGEIYVSSDFGATRILSRNIGIYPSNSIAISFSGQYQTASNGNSIYVSNDYGNSWTNAFTRGSSNLSTYISISLNGKYQIMVSSGDTVYMSENYGVVWRPLELGTNLYAPNNTVQYDLFQSIEAFPTAGVALSYNGLYQTIVSEDIYVSSDFGKTWKTVNSDASVIDASGAWIYGDKNWVGIAMSSDGKYQSAIDSGGKIYISSDYGNNWNTVNNSNLNGKIWGSISSSATGQYRTVLEAGADGNTGGDIYVTNDYGVTWTQVPDPIVQSKKWRAVSVSSDALLQCAVEYGGPIYMSNIMTTYGHQCP